MNQLAKFISFESVSSETLVNFNLITMICQECLERHTDPVDLKSDLEDLEAIITLGHTCDRLDHDIESVGSIELYMLIHNAKSVFYSSMSLTDEHVSVMMIDSVNDIIKYSINESRMFDEAVVSEIQAEAAHLLNNK